MTVISNLLSYNSTDLARPREQDNIVTRNFTSRIQNNFLTPCDSPTSSTQDSNGFDPLCAPFAAGFFGSSQPLVELQCP
jgi:hypothetical protein